MGELDRTVGRLAFGDRGTGRGVPLGLGLTLGERLFDEHVDGVAVLRVDHHQRAGLVCLLHDLEECLIVDHDRAFVGHEELIAGDPLLLDDAPELVHLR